MTMSQSLIKDLDEHVFGKTEAEKKNYLTALIRPSKISREKAFISVQSKSKLSKPTTDIRIAGANDDLDYLPLQRLVKPKADEVKQTEQEKKRKKSKKRKPKSSGLNDFLSSLND